MSSVRLAAQRKEHTRTGSRQRKPLIMCMPIYGLGSRRDVCPPLREHCKGDSLLEKGQELRRGRWSRMVSPSRFVVRSLTREIARPIPLRSISLLIRGKGSYGVFSALKAPPLAKGRCREATEGKTCHRAGLHCVSPKGKKKPAYSISCCRPATNTFYLPVL